MTKIYLASRYSRREQMKVLAVKLRAFGHTVVSRWLETDWVNRPNESSAAPPEYRAKYAVIDMDDVKTADVVINFTEAPGDGSRGGRHVEYGMAIAWQKQVIVVGYRENLFHELPTVIFFRDETDLLAALCPVNLERMCYHDQTGLGSGSRSGTDSLP